ncbi:MAG TPA: hypothetical protein VIK84_06170 [Haloplasmataceae bacterium]
MYYTTYEYPMYEFESENDRFVPFTLGLGLGSFGFGFPFYGRRPFFNRPFFPPFYGRRRFYGRPWWYRRYW